MLSLCPKNSGARLPRPPRPPTFQSLNAALAHPLRTKALRTVRTYLHTRDLRPALETPSPGNARAWRSTCPSPATGPAVAVVTTPVSAPLPLSSRRHPRGSSASPSTPSSPPLFTPSPHHLWAWTSFGVVTYPRDLRAQHGCTNAQSHGATASTNTQPGRVRLCTCVGATVIYARLLFSDAAGDGRAIEKHSFPCAALDFPCVDTVSGGTRPRVTQTGPLSQLVQHDPVASPARPQASRRTKNTRPSLASPPARASFRCLPPRRRALPSTLSPFTSRAYGSLCIPPRLPAAPTCPRSSSSCALLYSSPLAHFPRALGLGAQTTNPVCEREPSRSTCMVRLRF